MSLLQVAVSDSADNPSMNKNTIFLLNFSDNNAY